jgi:hypothetical protein
VRQPFSKLPAPFMNRNRTQQCDSPVAYRNRTTSPYVAFPRSVGPWTGTAVALLLICVGSAQAVCQFTRQPALLSRPASVVLIARLESLSVAAAPVASLSTLPSAVDVPAAQGMSITTRWALPSNLTTLRLTVYRDASVPGRVDATPETDQAQDTTAIAPRSAAPQSGQMVWLQGSGAQDEQHRTEKY